MEKYTVKYSSIRGKMKTLYEILEVSETASKRNNRKSI